MYRLEIEMPGLPQGMNGSHGHWSAKHKHAKLWHGKVLDAIAGRLPPEPLKLAKVTCTRFSARAMDGDNLAASFKHPIDGLVRAGVLEDDKYSNIGMPIYEWAIARLKHGRIRIVVEEVEMAGEQK